MTNSLWINHKTYIGDTMRYFKIDFSNGKHVLSFGETMLEVLEMAVLLNNSNPLRCIEISLDEYKAIQNG